MIRKQCFKMDKGKNCAVCLRWTGGGSGEITCNHGMFPCKIIRKFSFVLWLKAIFNIKTKYKIPKDFSSLNYSKY